MIDELIKLLNVDLQIDMDDNEFTEIYNKLEKTNIITKNSPQSYLNENKCHVEFDGDDFYVYLDGDFNVDNYKLKIEKG